MQVDHPDLEDVSVTDVLYALADPIRLSIIRRLADAECLGCRESAGAAVAKATLSRHYKTLRAAGLVRTVHDAGGGVRNHLRRDEVEARFPGLLDSVLNASGQA